MSTTTQTYTKTDVRRVFEMLEADLLMLARRTQAMELDHAKACADDIYLMALEECLKTVHVRLLDYYGELKRVHRYSVEAGVLSSSQRPGENRWPCLPDGALEILLEHSDNQKFEELKESGKLKRGWYLSNASVDYSRMNAGSSRFYSSQNYGLLRETFTD